MSHRELLERKATPQNPELLQELAMECGHAVLGRVTELEIQEEDFAGDPVLLRLSTADVTKARNGKKHIVRPSTAHSDIVKSVLVKTHPDVYQNPKGREILETACRDYTELDPNDDAIQLALQDTLDEILASDKPLPDLLRGVSAFAEAEQNHWSGVYETSLIKPALLMAAWMIAQERNEPLEYGERDA